jgi:hypothetical protein
MPPPPLLVAITKEGLQGYISMRECQFLCFKLIQFTLMGRKLNYSDLRDVLVDLANNTPFKIIAQRYNICQKTVKRIELSMDLYGQPYPPPSVVQGRPKLMLKYQGDVSISQ